MKVHWRLAHWWLTACGTSRPAKVAQSEDPSDVTCLSCRRSRDFAPHRDRLDILMMDARRGYRGRDPSGRRPFWERLAVEVDRYMEKHGRCWRSEILAKKTMQRTA